MNIDTNDSQYIHFVSDAYYVRYPDIVRAFYRFQRMDRKKEINAKMFAWKHYVLYGRQEGRVAEFKNNSFHEEEMKEDREEGEEDEFVITSKETFREACMRELPHARSILIPKAVKKEPRLETVLIEFRWFPHLEFLVRNTVIKLHHWNHTIVCGNKNFQEIKTMRDSICPDIRIIRMDIDNMVPSTYSELLTTKPFWEQFHGEKLLIYQEDSFLFHEHIEPFLDYDYVGAPWPKNQDDNKLCVGNGGFSLRTKTVMIKVIKNVKMTSLKLGKNTIEYMKNANSFVVPEDVYFTKAMIDFKLGWVAPWEIARKFSQESIPSENPVGGHNFFLANHQHNDLTLDEKYMHKDDEKLMKESTWKEFIERNDVFSFDVFDTLLFRNVDEPTSVFKLINDEEFYQTRINAEKIAMEKNRFYTIYDIYRHKSMKNYDLNVEIEKEKELLFFNLGFEHFLSYLTEQGKKIILTSDMYLPKSILKIIIKKKIPHLQYHELYVSCDLKLGKWSTRKDQSIYRYLKSKYEKMNIFHIGDNFDSDCKNATLFGFDSYYFNKQESSSNIFIDLNFDNEYHNIGFHRYGVLSKLMYDKLEQSISQHSDTLFLLCTRDMNFFYDKLHYKHKNVRKLCISRTSSIKLIWNAERLKHPEQYMPVIHLKNMNVHSDEFNMEESLKNTQEYRGFFSTYLENLTHSYEKIRFVDIGWGGTQYRFLKLFFEEEMEHLSNFKKNMEFFLYFLHEKNTYGINMEIESMLSLKELQGDEYTRFYNAITNGDKIEYGFCNNDDVRCIGYTQGGQIEFQNDEDYNITTEIQHGMHLYLKYHDETKSQCDTKNLLQLLDEIVSLPTNLFQNMNKLF